MQLDVAYPPGDGFEATDTVVMIAMTEERERALSDSQWTWVARNQHCLRWAKGSLGKAALPPSGAKTTDEDAVVRRLNGWYLTVTLRD